jgi:hypothetical protein
MSRFSAAVTLALLFIVSAVASFAYAQSAHRPAVVSVSKARFWIPDVFRNFRKTNTSAPALPKYAVPIQYPTIAKHTAVLDETTSRIIVYGGEIPDVEMIRRPGHLATSDVYQYDVPQNKWYQEAPFTAAPAPRLDHVAWMVGGAMWIHGGKGALTAYSDVWTYRNRTWHRFPDEGPRLSGHSADRIAPNAVWVFGGRNDRDYSSRLYNTFNGTFNWVKTTGQAPTPRCYHATAVMNNTLRGVKFFVMGGFDGQRSLGDIYSIAFTSGNSFVWTFLNPGRSDPVTSYDGVQITGVDVPGLARHACAAQFPIVICVGNGGGDRSTVVEYDDYLTKWLPSYTSNPDMLPPISGGKSVRMSKSETGKPEFWVVGGLKGAPNSYNYPRAILKTNLLTEACPEGYINPDFDGRCLLCGSGSAVYFDENPHRCKICPPGTYERYGECRNCPRSTYQPKNGTTNVTFCLACPAGYFTVNEGADGPEDCITCPIGTYAVPNGCANCPAGTYGVLAGQQHYDLGCEPCSYGYYSREGATSCTACAPGSSTGPFIERNRPHKISLYGMGVINPAGSAPSNCPAGPLVTTVVAGTWFYMILTLADYGDDGTLRALNPMRRQPTWNNAHLDGGVTDVTAEFEGDVSRMYYNCRDTSLAPPCSSVGVNQTSLVVSTYNLLPGCYTQNADFYIVLALRFDDTSFNTTLRIRSDGIVGLEIPLKIIANGELVNITNVPPVYVGSKAVASRFIALDLLLRFDPTATGSFLLAAQCGAGVAAPRFKVNGAAASTSKTLTFVGGIVDANIELVDQSRQCRWFITRNARSRLDATLWSSQLPSLLDTSLTATNVTSGSVINVYGIIRNVTGDIVTGDDSTMLRLELAPGRPYNQYIRIQEGSHIARVSGGIARFTFHVTSSYPNPNVLVSGAFVLSVDSGLTPTPLPVETEKFYIATNKNGTTIRMLTDRYPFPTTPMMNRTFKVELQLQDKGGSVVGYRNPRIYAELVGCPSLRLSIVNTSSPYVTLIQGHAVVSLVLTGKDGANCRILFHEVGYDPEYTPHGAWSPVFNVMSPHHLRHNNTCKPPSCAVSCNFEVGYRYWISVAVVTDLNVDLMADQQTVIKLQVQGNESGAFEATGQPERRVTNGAATFVVEFRESATPVVLTWMAGYWTTADTMNITHIGSPYFRTFYEVLGSHTVWHRSPIWPISTCQIIPKVTTSQLVVTNRIPTWVMNDEPFLIEMVATNDRGIVDGTYSGAFSIRVDNCNHGLKGYGNEFTWALIRDQQYTQTSIPLATSVAAGTFSGGRARVRVVPKYQTQTYFTSGLKQCSVRVTSGVLRTLFVENFQVRKIFPACTLCRPGTWSVGGTGVTATTNVAGVSNFHAGGCVKCLMGTFSSTTGSTSETACQVCPKDYGARDQDVNSYQQEGRTSCTTACTYGSPGLVNGGPCTGSIGAVANLNQYDNAYFARLGRRCNLGLCNNIQTCPAGMFRLDCTAVGLGSQASCEGSWNKGLCLWNTTTATPFCQGTTYTCVPCPAGSVSIYTNWGGIGDCVRCNPGGWSEDEGHAQAYANQLQWEPFRCDAVFNNGALNPTWPYDRLCFGSGTGQCWNGTASSTLGALSNASCLVCPKGTYAHQRLIYDINTCNAANCAQVDFINPFCARQFNCRDCPLDPFTVGGVPYLVGARTCTPCPAGTFNNKTGRWDPFAHCLPCPAGTYCPAGTIEPLKTDGWNTQLDLSGTTMPQAVSFDRNAKPITCAGVDTSNEPGYVRDGSFSNYIIRHYQTADLLYRGFHEEWHNEHTHDSSFISYVHDPTDRLGNAMSGSAKCNATGCEFYQNIVLNHLVRSDYVARVWVMNNLTYLNTSTIMRHELSSHKPFAGIKVTFYSDTNWTLAQSFTQAASIPVIPFGAANWIPLEIKSHPPWPAAFVQVNLTVQSYYIGFALFDDVQLRPSIQRICNCSTGFYFNESRPERPCTRCPPGFACSGGQLVRCENSWTVSAEPGCNVCRSGWQCDADGRGRSIPCADFNRKDNTTETCSPCPLGYACQDGDVFPCSGGTYGDGGKQCVNCLPGFFSLPGAPVRECTRCPPGTQADHMRMGCETCPMNHFSPDGMRCLECPAGSFTDAPGQGSCTSCTAALLGTVAHTVYRNSENRLAVVPSLCVEDYDWAVESLTQVSGSTLGEVSASPSTIDSVLYRALGKVGLHKFRAFVTPALHEPYQQVNVDVTIDNRAPAVNDDPLIIAHPKAPYTMDLSFVLFNDFDPDTDDVFFATAAFGGASYAATNIAISADRKHLSVDLPVGFLGPAVISYTVMDEYHATTAACVAPACKFSPTATVTIVAKDAPPSTKVDLYEVLNGRVYSFDVVANDTDPDNDDIDVVFTGPSIYGTTPAIAAVCSIGPACGWGTCRGVAGCTCAVDPNRLQCWPSTGRRYVINYAAPATRCGTDQFQYGIKTNDGIAYGTVFARVRRCYCATPSMPVKMVFMVDATTSMKNLNWQLSMVDAIQKRAVGGLTRFQFALFGVGQSTRWANLSTAYISTEFIDPNPHGSLFPYALGAALQKVGDGTATSALQVPVAGERSVLVIFSAHESTDSVVVPGSQLTALYGAGRFHTAVISIAADRQDYKHAGSLNPLYRAAVTDFETDLQDPQIAYDLMDEVCSL